MSKHYTSSAYKQWKKDWNEFLKNANLAMREGISRQLNRASDEVVAQMKTNMADAGIHNRTGRLRIMLRIHRATPKSPRCVIYSEAEVPRPKRPNWNRHLWRKKGWSMNGLNLGKDLRYPPNVSYGRILEFSPRINKPFFYKAWYDKQRAVKERVIYAVRNCWQTQVNDFAG